MGQVGGSVPLEHRRMHRSEAGKCRNRQAIADVPNAAPACLAERSGMEFFRDAY